MSLVRPPTRPALVLAIVSGAQFMIILDLAIVNVALSAIQADFAVSQSDLQWIVIGYGLALGGFLLLGGRLADVLRSEEHTSELQSRQYLVCRLLLEKKKKKTRISKATPKPQKHKNN